MIKHIAIKDYYFKELGLLVLLGATCMNFHITSLVIWRKYQICIKPSDDKVFNFHTPFLKHHSHSYYLSSRIISENCQDIGKAMKYAIKDNCYIK